MICRRMLVRARGAFSPVVQQYQQPLPQLNDRFRFQHAARIVPISVHQQACRYKGTGKKKPTSKPTRELKALRAYQFQSIGTKEQQQQLPTSTAADNDDTVMRPSTNTSALQQTRQVMDRFFLGQPSSAPPPLDNDNNDDSAQQYYNQLVSKVATLPEQDESEQDLNMESTMSHTHDAFNNNNNDASSPNSSKKLWPRPWHFHRNNTLGQRVDLEVYLRDVTEQLETEFYLHETNSKLQEITRALIRNMDQAREQLALELDAHLKTTTTTTAEESSSEVVRTDKLPVAEAD